VRRILGIHSLAEYVTTIQQCPIIPLLIHWMWQGPILHYMFIENVPEEATKELISTAPSKLSNLRMDFEMLQTQITVANKDNHNRIINLNVRLDATDQRLSRQSKAIDQSVNRTVQEGTRQIEDIFKSQLAAFNLQLKMNAQAAVISFRQDIQAEITRLKMKSSTAATKFRTTIQSIAESTTDKMQNDLYISSTS